MFAFVKFFSLMRMFAAFVSFFYDESFDIVIATDYFKSTALSNTIIITQQLLDEAYLSTQEYYFNPVAVLIKYHALLSNLYPFSMVITTFSI